MVKMDFKGLVGKGLVLPKDYPPAQERSLETYSGLIQGIIKWAEHQSPLKLSFDDLTGIQKDVPQLKVDDLHEIHTCNFCMFAKQNPVGLKDCQRNKHAVNWLIMRNSRGLSGYCHLGLFDIAEPLIIEGRVLGVFYFGSVLVTGKERQTHDRILRYCGKRNFDPEPYFKLLQASPLLDPNEIPIHQQFLRSLTALAVQCSLSAGIRAADYSTSVLAMKYRPEDELPYLVKEAIRFIRERLYGPLLVKDIATHLRCHPNFLSKEFKKHIKIELAPYICNLRIGRAVQIMGNSKLTVSQIADECGFGDRVYFGKLFRRTTGMTPGQYRRHLASLGKYPKSPEIEKRSLT